LFLHPDLRIQHIFVKDLFPSAMSLHCGSGTFSNLSTKNSKKDKSLLFPVLRCSRFFTALFQAAKCHCF
jgi:hypothetical protein